MRDFVIRIHESGNQSWVHVFFGPTYWAVEFEEDMVSSGELLAVAVILDDLHFDLEVQVGAVL